MELIMKHFKLIFILAAVIGLAGCQSKVQYGDATEVETVNEIRRISEDHAEELVAETCWRLESVREACRTFAGTTATGIDDINLRTAR